jgi:hypothetical protein
MSPGSLLLCHNTGEPSRDEVIEAIVIVAQQLDKKSPLSPQRAFVVQFYAEVVLERGHCAGRVEHVVSGQAIHFCSLEELLTFMGRILSTARTRPPNES